MDTGDIEVLTRAVEWLEDNRSVELVTVVRTFGSSPRPPGSLAAVRDDGVLVGSVSGGCVEKQLAEAYQGDATAKIRQHQIDDAEARRYGLACGGQLELIFETLTDPAPLKYVLDQLSQRRRTRRRVSLGDSSATFGEAAIDDQFEFDGDMLQQVFGPQWRVLLVGAGQLSRFTAEFAKALDFDVVVVDPRPEFRAAWQVPGTLLLDASPDDAVVSHGSDPHTAVLALTHEINLDDLALIEALPSGAFYVGALGSTRNYARRCERLAFLDVDAQSIDRLRGPIGLSIGSRTSAEIALSIMAELVKVRAALTRRR